jgi:hypothetical protein
LNIASHYPHLNSDTSATIYLKGEERGETREFILFDPAPRDHAMGAESGLG